MSIFDKIKDALTPDEQPDPNAPAANPEPAVEATRSATAEEIAQAQADAAAAEAKAAADAMAEADAAAAAAAAKAKADAAAAAAKAAAEHVTYTVKSGDTLSAIGAHFGVDWHAIATLNHIKNPDLIFPGQVFKIPHK